MPLIIERQPPPTLKSFCEEHGLTVRATERAPKEVGGCNTRWIARIDGVGAYSAGMVGSLLAGGGSLAGALLDLMIAIRASAICRIGDGEVGPKLIDVPNLAGHGFTDEDLSK